MERNVIISVIMPIYNVEKYLEKAVKSVLNQSFKDFELILVDNCSPDNCGEICDEFARLDSRVKVLHQKENLGPGPARNAGIDISKGKYIAFCDGDDHIDSDMLEVLYKKAQEEDYDIVISGYYQDFLNAEDELEYTVDVLPPEIEAATHKECVEAVPFLDTAKVLAVSWNKLYKASIIKENNVRFPAIMHSEDYFFIVELFGYINTMVTVQREFYHYMKTQTATLTNLPYLKGFTELVNKRFVSQRKLLESAGVYDGKARELACSVHIKHIFSDLENDCSKQSGMSRKQRKAKVKEMLKNPNTLEALKHTGNTSKMQTIMNKIIKTGSPLTVGMAGKLIWFMKHRMSGLFNKLKIK